MCKSPLWQGVYRGCPQKKRSDIPTFYYTTILYCNSLFWNKILGSGVKSLILRRIPTHSGDRGEEGDAMTKSDGETALQMLTGGFSCQFRFCKKLGTQNSDQRSGIIPVALVFYWVVSNLSVSSRLPEASRISTRQDPTSWA